MTTMKVRAEHLSRNAFVYIRQSTQAQVIHHRESTERQYDLSAKAKNLGWDEGRVEVIDDDLGQSGATATNRAGFQRLAGEVSLGRVGAIFSLEVSRLARSSADWHRLLDLCALSNTLIADDDGLYDPNDFNDRLILGMKGTMSDAERHVMRLRLAGGRLHKAKKGELLFRAPTGYLFDDTGTMALDPDEQLQEAVKLVFARFRLEGSAWKVVKYFRDRGLMFPTRVFHQEGTSSVVWKPLTHERVLLLLHNPAYAGAYTYGRRQNRRVVVDGGAVLTRNRRLPSSEWIVFIKDRHEAYITWEDHMDNVKRLSDNRMGAAVVGRHGVPRNGPALLQGIVLCGTCGRRMGVLHVNQTDAFYLCHRRRDAAPGCWSVSACHIDEQVAKIFLDAVAPPEIDLSLAVVREVEKQATQIDRQWQLRIERAQYEVERAERQYNAVEPENRTVARTLETRWNEKLLEMERIKREHEEARRAHHLQITAADKKAIMALARDLPRVWNAPSTTQAERKQLIRMLVDEVVIEPVDDPRRVTKIRVLWKTGATTETSAPRPSRSDARRPPEEVIDAIRELAHSGLGDGEVAAALNTRGFLNADGGSYNVGSIQHHREVNGIRRGREPSSGSTSMADVDERGRLSVNAVAKRYGVKHHTVMRWIERGLIPDERAHEHSMERHRITLTPELDERLQTAAAGRKIGKPMRIADRDERGRYSLNALAEKLAVKRSTIVNWMKRGIIPKEPRDQRGGLRITLTAALATRLRAAKTRLPTPRPAPMMDSDKIIDQN